MRMVDSCAAFERSEEERTFELYLAIVLFTSVERVYRRPNSDVTVDSVFEEPPAVAAMMINRMTMPTRTPRTIFIFLSKKPVWTG